LDAGVLPDGRPYLVSEYCPGGTLADLVRPAVAVVVELGATLAGTLARAHAEGVVHRDLKPANVLLRADGEPALADFGLSVRPAGGASRGADALSVEWAAPETLERGEYGRRATCTGSARRCTRSWPGGRRSRTGPVRASCRSCAGSWRIPS